VPGGQIDGAIAAGLAGQLPLALPLPVARGRPRLLARLMRSSEQRSTLCAAAAAPGTTAAPTTTLQRAALPAHPAEPEAGHPAGNGRQQPPQAA
jgi:hypothetical protein